MSSLAVLGSSVASAPLDAVRIVIGTLVLLFGIGWLRNAIVHRALAPAPANAFALGVGVMVSAVGLHGFGEAIGITWPLGPAAIPILVTTFLAASMAGVRLARRGALA